MKKMYCVWLKFDSADLSEIIVNLSQKYNGPVFEPHCTLIGKTDVSLPKLKSAIIGLNSNFDLSKVHTKEINYSDNYWRTLFIELDEKKVLTKWHEYIRHSLSIDIDKKYLPLISLMYNYISREEKKRIAENIRLQSTYKIKSIQIVDCSDKVDEWHTVFEYKIEKLRLKI